jgi:hypothetical protein
MSKNWATLEFSLEPLLKPILPILETIDGVLSALIAILNIVQKILDVIKVFLFGLLDPIRALVELIIEEIRRIIQDLRQIGVYLAGDWALVDPSNGFADIIGGYAAYEQRMTQRLLDTGDPNRPNFSSSSVALAVFLYASSGDISVILRAIYAIMKLFGRADLLGNKAPYQTPTAPQILFGSSAAGIASFRTLGKTFSSDTPNSISISWAMPTGTSKSPIRNPSPKGFLIHVSTIESGLEVLTLTSNPISPNPVTPNRITGSAIDPVTGFPLRLFGGISDIGAADDPRDFSGVESPNPQAPLLCLRKDQVTPLIKPSTLKPSGGGPPLLGNTYFVRMSDLSPQRIGGGTRYTATIPLEDLPLDVSFRGGSDGFAEIEGSPYQPQNYWIRVRALTRNYADFIRDSGTSGNLLSPASLYESPVRIYQITNSDIKGAATQNGIITPQTTGTPNTTSAQVSFKDLTSAGGPGVVIVPTGSQLAYQEALQSALVLAILCRADLTEQTPQNTQNVYVEGTALGFEEAVREFLAQFQVGPDFFKESRPQVFREKIKRLVLSLPPNSPPSGVVDSILESCQNLLEFTWNEIDGDYPELTILQSIGIGGDPEETSGLGANPFCRTLPKKDLQWAYASGVTTGNRAGPQRSPCFLERRVPGIGWVQGGGSADLSPILYNDRVSRSPVKYVRNAVYDYNAQILLKEASLVLRVALSAYALPATDGGWLAIRLMPQALVPLDLLLEKVDRFLQGVLDGLQGIIDQIIRYIESVQARIFQLQALLELIRSLLRSIQLFQLPSLSALVMVESGTGGIVTGLITSENKPQDDANDYGAGVVAIAGGIPTVLLEILALLFSGGEEE